MKFYFALLVITFFTCFAKEPAYSQAIAGNTETNLDLVNPSNKTRIRINLPLPIDRMDKRRRTSLVFYALPNGNSIEWTMGKLMQPGDDWHYDIQHIAAQTRYLRDVMKDQNLVVIYMANELKSWPAWKRERKDGPGEIRQIVDSITGMFSRFSPDIILNSHSGGGSFIFGYLDAVKDIPDNIARIAFIDSDYGYEDSLHTLKLARWLAASTLHHLNVLAYNDSVVIYNGKPLVSPTGGTWYRTKLMQQKLSAYFSFKKEADTSLIHYTSLSNRVDIYLKINDQGKIYHTEQVARNGFIHTLISGTKYQHLSGYRYWGDRVYNKWIYP